MKIILASGSPRRRELLRELGLNFEVYKPEVDETRKPDELPEELCFRLSRMKALNAAKIFENSIIISADTIVVINSDILGKPKNREDTFRMLSELQGKWHEVLTGISVSMNDKIISHVEHTRVKFKALTEAEILKYLETGESDDKAGAYAIQGKGALFIERIDGDFYNVVGLPLCVLGKMLAEFGIMALNHHAH